MRKTFDEDEPPLPPGGVLPLPMQRKLACSFCQAPTPVEVLNNFGARCGACFTNYCRSMPELPKAGVRREDVGERAYAAHRLGTWEARHMERMTPAQRDFLATVARADAGRGAEAAGVDAEA